jgi:curved DNA-binding protein CbpA
MNINTALSILGLEAGQHTAKEIKAAYKKACLKYHPDRNPAGAEMMQAINEAWVTLKDLKEAKTDSDNAGYDSAFSDKLSEALNAVINLAVDIEVCGSWIWVTGDTYQYKDIIKAAGYRWAKKKAAWYFRPEEENTKRRGGSWSMDKIRGNHGSKKVKTKSYASLSA